jgi:WXG100 family type VII secretion target
MALIKISPEEVEAVAKQVRASKEQSQQIINGLTQKIHALEANWEGMSKQKFAQDFQTAQKSMNQFVQLLDSIANELTHIAAKFRQADQS